MKKLNLIFVVASFLMCSFSLGFDVVEDGNGCRMEPVVMPLPPPVQTCGNDIKDPEDYECPCEGVKCGSGRHCEVGACVKDAPMPTSSNEGGNKASCGPTDDLIYLNENDPNSLTCVPKLKGPAQVPAKKPKPKPAPKPKPQPKAKPAQPTNVPTGKQGTVRSNPGIDPVRGTTSAPKTTNTTQKTTTPTRTTTGTRTTPAPTGHCASDGPTGDGHTCR